MESIIWWSLRWQKIIFQPNPRKLYSSHSALFLLAFNTYYVLICLQTISPIRIMIVKDTHEENIMTSETLLFYSLLHPFRMPKPSGVKEYYEWKNRWSVWRYLSHNRANKFDRINIPLSLACLFTNQELMTRHNWKTILPVLMDLFIDATLALTLE